MVNNCIAQGELILFLYWIVQIIFLNEYSFILFCVFYLYKLTITLNV